MKKILAIFLSALLICISLAPMSLAVTDPGFATRVMEGEYDSENNGTDVITETTFTVAVKVPAVKKLTGVNLYFEFDPAVLSVTNASVAGVADEDGNFNAFFNGIYVNGYKTGSDSEYSFGWISNNGVTKNSARDIFYITFNVLDTTKTDTAINLYVEEFRTDDGNDKNDVTSTLLAENMVVSFLFPEGTPPVTQDDVTEGEGDVSADDINILLDLIRDILNGNSVTFADVADAIVNMFGNVELMDIIEQLVDGNVDISDMFQQILDGLGIDFSFLEDLLNKIIDFLLGLFGPKDEPTTTPTETTEVVTEETTVPNPDTTAEGSSQGSEETGDAGIALAATICVAASAAFVLTRKKKETV